MMQNVSVSTAIERSPSLCQALVSHSSSATRPAATGLLLLASDAITLLIAGWLGVRVWSSINSSVAPAAYWHLWPVVAVFLAVYSSLGLYPGAGLHPVEELRSVALGTTIGYLVSGASIFLAKEVGVPSRGVFLASWGCSIILAPLGRAFTRQIFAKRSWWGIPVLVLGAGESARMVVDRLKGQPGLGLKPVACLDDDDRRRISTWNRAFSRHS